MKTIQVTVERNFHIMNEDRFIMEKISQVIVPEEGDTTMDCINAARGTITENFIQAYPHLRTYLNFDEVIQVKKNYMDMHEVLPLTAQGMDDRFKEVMQRDENLRKRKTQAGEIKIGKGTLEEQIASFEGTPDQLKKEWFYPASMNKKLKDVYDERYLELSK